MEYIQVLEGILAVEVEGREHVLRPENGEFTVGPWTIHRLYTLPAARVGEPSPEDSNIVRFMASAEKTLEVFKMDLLFFENWYKYQDEVIRRKQKIDIIQAICVGLPLHVADAETRPSQLTMATDIRCRRIIHDSSMVGAIPADLITACRNHHREMASSLVWISALLSQVVNGLGTGGGEDGFIDFSSAMGGWKEDRSTTQHASLKLWRKTSVSTDVESA